MQTRNVRELAVLMPGDQPDELDPIDNPPTDNSTTAGGVIEGDSWTRAQADGCSITRCWFVNADLSSIEFSNATFDRCILRGSALIGAHLTDTTFKNVIFENCRFDYATLTLVRAAGPVAFIGCSITETVFDRCQLTTVVFDGCKLASPTFANCDMRGADLRGNDLSKTIGVTTSFRATTINEEQVASLTEAMLRELEVSIKAR